MKVIIGPYGSFFSICCLFLGGTIVMVALRTIERGMKKGSIDGA